ncbi:LacI family DNA-binding transcriptional regulator [Pseudonocardia sp. CA-107938]|uniref:LacI family DNA-binding transcriptional regulator n=1 Tax=Pseudonocardia sp. CA-107938 TaxID=3240021 RepID=UPI003D8D3E8E
MPKLVRDPSILDVARLAGVSHQTVSRVLNDHPNVRDTTRQRVRSAIAELGYRPNRAARALVTGSYRSIGVVAPRSTLYGPASLLAAFEEQSALEGFTVTVTRLRTFTTSVVREAVGGLLDQRVAGLIVIAPLAAAADALDDLPDDLPLVAVDGHPSRAGSSATVDQVTGARLATAHLLDAGHGTVWHVSGPPDWFDAAGRVTGWQAELRARGIDPPPVIDGDWTADSGYRAGQLLGRMPEVTAVFVANDAMAVGVLHALHEHGRRVPDDVSIVGFDDVPEAAHFIPPLTTVRQDFDAVARESLALLIERIDGSESVEGRLVVPSLVVRSSVAPPPGR